MPRTSVRGRLMEYKINEIMCKLDFLEDLDREEEMDEAWDDFMDDIIAIQSCRRGDEVKVPKSIQWKSSILCAFDDERFLSMMRVTKVQFQFLHDLIKMDKVFRNSNPSLQKPVDQQLAIVLYRLGQSGEGASVRNLSSLFGIGDGGSIAKITDRVFSAILRKLPEFIKWPNEYEREQLVAASLNELPHCIGYIDNSEIKFAEKPRMNHEIYCSRQGNYCIKVQIVCDHKLKIRDVVVGNPGSYQDAKIFNKCKIWQKRDQLFSGEQWIAGDSAFPLSEYLIPPYCSNSVVMDAKRRHKFNRRHSKYHVRVANCFGILKEKFGSLKEMRIQIGSDKSQMHFCKWVLVCCVLHNILLQERDIFAYEKKSDSMAETDDVEYEDMFETAPSAEEKRQRLYTMMFQ